MNEQRTMHEATPEALDAIAGAAQMSAVHIAISGKTIVLAARESEKADLAAVVQRVTAALDEAGIRYTAREFTVMARPAERQVVRRRGRTRGAR